MVALIIIGVIAAIIALIMLIPVGADIAFEGGELKASAKFCGVLLQLYPKPPEDEKKKKAPKSKKKEKQKEAEPAEEKKAPELPKFNKEELLELAKAGIGALGRFGRKLKVDRFLLHYTAAGQDPYNTAVTFAYVNAALSTLAPICAKRFTVKDCSVWTVTDFTKEHTELDFGLAMSIRIGQIFGVINSVGFKALKILLRNKKRIKAENAAAAARDTASAAGETENINTENENIQAEERKNSNG